MHLIKGLETAWSEAFPVSCNSAFRGHICLIGPFLQWLCFTEFSWVKYRLLMIVLQDCNLYHCDMCTKRGRKSHWNRGAFQLITPLNSATVNWHSGPALSRSAPLTGSWNFAVDVFEIVKKKRIPMQ